MFAYYTTDTHEYSLMTDLLKPWYTQHQGKIEINDSQIETASWLALCILIVISLGLYSFVITSGPRYRAETTLFVWTPTNGSFARSFPQELAKTVPGIIRLEMFPGSYNYT